MITVISDKKQTLIDELNNSPLKKGETVIVNIKAITKKETSCTIVSIDDEEIVVKVKGLYGDKYTVSKKDIVRRFINNIGVNPFDDTSGAIRAVAFSLESILYSLNILGDKKKQLSKIHGIEVMEVNWNPFVYDKHGKKQYYQRPFVWELKDKQLLVESIYNNIDCGKVLIKKRSWEELEVMAKNGETELSFRDIVDGKQRLRAIGDFVMGKFADIQGNYYADLSNTAQNKFIGNQLIAYAEMEDNTKDEVVIQQFLKLNFCGVQQSEEHINFVKSLKNKL